MINHRAGSRAARRSGHCAARGEQRLLHRVLARVEVPVAADERAEDLRRERAQQILDVGVRAHISGRGLVHERPDLDLAGCARTGRARRSRALARGSRSRRCRSSRGTPWPRGTDRRSRPATPSRTRTVFAFTWSATPVRADELAASRGAPCCRRPFAAMMLLATPRAGTTSTELVVPVDQQHVLHGRLLSPGAPDGHRSAETSEPGAGSRRPPPRNLRRREGTRAAPAGRPRRQRRSAAAARPLIRPEMRS